MQPLGGTTHAPVSHCEERRWRNPSQRRKYRMEGWTKHKSSRDSGNHHGCPGPISNASTYIRTRTRGREKGALRRNFLAALNPSWITHCLTSKVADKLQTSPNCQRRSRFAVTGQPDSRYSGTTTRGAVPDDRSLAPVRIDSVRSYKFGNSHPIHQDAPRHDEGRMTKISIVQQQYIYSV